MSVSTNGILMYVKLSRAKHVYFFITYLIEASMRNNEWYGANVMPRNSSEFIKLYRKQVDKEKYHTLIISSNRVHLHCCRYSTRAEMVGLCAVRVTKVNISRFT